MVSAVVFAGAGRKNPVTVVQNVMYQLAKTLQAFSASSDPHLGHDGVAHSLQYTVLHFLHRYTGKWLLDRALRAFLPQVGHCAKSAMETSQNTLNTMTTMEKKISRVNKIAVRNRNGRTRNAGSVSRPGAGGWCRERDSNPHVRTHTRP